MRIFVAGIMQGSFESREMHRQDYRRRIIAALRTSLPEADIYDPWAGHQDSIEYEPEDGRRVFLDHNRRCGEVDVLVAYVPQASMGTAVEMWEAWRHGKAVLTITGMTHNWMVRFCSDWRFPTLEAFEAVANRGELRRRLPAVRERAATRKGTAFWEASTPIPAGDEENHES